MSLLLEGKKTFLFSLTRMDIDSLHEALADDENMTRMGVFDWDIKMERQLPKYLRNIIPSKDIRMWVALTKEGKASRKVGYFWLSPVTLHWANIEGIIANQFALGLDKELKKKKLTYFEDAVSNVVKSAMTHLHRLGYVSVQDDTDFIKILGNVGFRREGVIKGVLKYEPEKFSDIVQYAIVKE